MTDDTTTKTKLQAYEAARMCGQPKKLKHFFILGHSSNNDDVFISSKPVNGTTTTSHQSDLMTR